MSEIDEIVHEFLAESREGLDQLDRDLLALDDDPNAGDPLDSAFRALHTVKGTAGLLGYAGVEELAHAAEQVLGGVREGSTALSPAITAALLMAGDALRAQLAHIEETDSDDHPAPEAALRALDAAASPNADGPPGGDGVVAVPMPASSPPAASAEPVTDLGAATSPEAAAGADVQAASVAVAPTVAATAGGIEAASELAALHDDGEHTPASVATVGVLESTVRVDVAVLDDLMNLVGELVLARNRLRELAAGRVDADLTSVTGRLHQVTGELQQRVSRTRMQPLSVLWGKLPRLVHDLAIACGKEVRIETHGADTELDRSVLEAIRDPVTHLVRNAIDHGIESPAVRAAAGKPVEGCLSLRAFHESGRVHIEFSDDGGGIDLEAVRRRAVDRRLLDPAAAERLDDRELLQLVFAPSFSTTDAVTQLSGRGVGMDVVKTNVERIGGTVDLRSVRGEGTVCAVTIPLTLAIVPALAVCAGDDRFLIPQVHISELVRLDPAASGPGVEDVLGSQVYRRHGQLIPVIDLVGVIAGDGPRPTMSSASRTLVVIHVDGERFGLVVDGVQDTQDIVVKPLGRCLSDIQVFAGATIMGDGRAALILDVHGLAKRADVLTSHTSAWQATEPIAPEPETADRVRMLVVQASDTRQAVLPLHAVARLERHAREGIERLATGAAVQSRGKVLPLVELAVVLGAEVTASADPFDVVVLDLDAGRRCGLVVDAILDVVEVDAADSGSSIVDGRIIEHVPLDRLRAASRSVDLVTAGR